MKWPLRIALAALFPTIALVSNAASPPPDAVGSPPAAADATGGASKDAEVDKYCAPAEMAIVKESLGRTLSAEKAAVAAAMEATHLVSGGAGRYWSRVRDQWLNARTPKVAPAQAASSTGPGPDKDRPSGYIEPSKTLVCKVLASRDSARCAEIGEGKPLCEVVASATKRTGRCEGLGALEGACRYLVGGTPKACASSGKDVCDFITRVRAKDALQACVSDDDLPCDIVGVLRGVGGQGVSACKSLSSAERTLCEAVVNGRSQECDGALPKAPQAPSGPANVKVQARLLGSSSGSPRVLMLATADRPMLCHVSLMAPATGDKALWEGIVRVPEYRSLSTLVDDDVAAAAAPSVDPMRASELTSRVHCVDRYYW